MQVWCCLQSQPALSGTGSHPQMRCQLLELLGDVLSDKLPLLCRNCCLCTPLLLRRELLCLQMTPQAP
jgi:hypothetical protein